jgi:hypothetical protein
MKLSRPSTLLLATVILWTVAYAGWTAGWMLDPMPYALERALRRIPLCVMGVLLCLAMGRTLDRARGHGPWRLGACAVLAVAVSITLHALANELVFYVIRPRWGGPEWAHIPSVMMDTFWVYAAWVLLYFALSADAIRRDRETRLARASAQAIDAQHKLLVQQINPHFLFNALNTVYALVLEHDETRARQSLLALSAFLRRSLEADAPLHVPLRDELLSVRHYLEIEMARFGERLWLVETAPEALLELEVPNLILQPLVENCVKHGLRHYEGAITITLTAMLEGGSLVVRVENDGATVAAPAVHGVGLGHVAQRLRLLHGKAGVLDAHPREGGGFVACIRLPVDA